MAKPKKVRYSGVAVLANGYILSRVQNVNVSTDLGEEEARELTNTEVVEYTSTQPQVSVSIETNEYGSCRNLRAVLGITGGTIGSRIVINPDFENAVADISILMEEDNILSRSHVINDAYLTSISWNYDVGGVATESYNLEADNQNRYRGSMKEMVSFMAITGTYTVAAGVIKCVVPFNPSTWSGYKFYMDGVAATGLIAATSYNYGGDTSWAGISSYDANFTTTGSRMRCFAYKRTPDTNITSTFKTSTNSIGSITRGKINIELVSGEGAALPGTTNFLRLQSASISMDLNREILNELGHYRAFERSLTYPVPVNITFSALASDLQEYALFQGITAFESDEEYTITDFIKKAILRVTIWDKNDTDTTRSSKKGLIISGLQVISNSSSVDVGGNATEDFTCKASNIMISGYGFPAKNPSTSQTAVTD